MLNKSVKKFIKDVTTWKERSTNKTFHDYNMFYYPNAFDIITAHMLPNGISLDRLYSMVGKFIKLDLDEKNIDYNNIDKYMASSLYPEKCVDVHFSINNLEEVFFRTDFIKIIIEDFFNKENFIDNIFYLTAISNVLENREKDHMMEGYKFYLIKTLRKFYHINNFKVKTNYYKDELVKYFRTLDDDDIEKQLINGFSTYGDYQYEYIDPFSIKSPENRINNENNYSHIDGFAFHILETANIINGSYSAEWVSNNLDTVEKIEEIVEKYLDAITIKNAEGTPMGSLLYILTKMKTILNIIKPNDGKVDWELPTTNSEEYYELIKEFKEYVIDKNKAKKENLVILIPHKRAINGFPSQIEEKLCNTLDFNMTEYLLEDDINLDNYSKLIKEIIRERKRSNYITYGSAISPHKNRYNPPRADSYDKETEERLFDKTRHIEFSRNGNTSITLLDFNNTTIVCNDIEYSLKNSIHFTPMIDVFSNVIKKRLDLDNRSFTLIAPKININLDDPLNGYFFNPLYTSKVFRKTFKISDNNYTHVFHDRCSFWNESVDNMETFKEQINDRYKIIKVEGGYTEFDIPDVSINFVD
jgi:hypothetical protein